MIFKRKIYQEMLEWKRASHGESTLMVEGARRIGKRTIVEEFAKNEYASYLILDFAQERKDVLTNFLLVKNRRLCPLEVKSSGYKKHKSFDYFIKKYQLKVNERYIIYTKDLQLEDGDTYLPVYMAMFL